MRRHIFNVPDGVTPTLAEQALMWMVEHGEAWRHTVTGTLFKEKITFYKLDVDDKR